MPQQRLYFLPLPQGQGSLRPVCARLGGEQVHDLRSLAAAREDLGHQAHRSLRVREERLEPGAEPVEAGLTVGREQQAVLWALAVAGEEVLARAAEGGQRLLLGLPERALLLGAHEVADGGLEDVAEQVARIDEVVAGVDVAVVLERHPLAAGRLEDAETRGAANVGGEHAVKGLHEHLADVAAHPLVEDCVQEAAVVLRLHAAPGYRPRPAARGRRLDLDDRDELDEAGAELVAEEAVHLERVPGVGGVDRAQHVELGAVLLQAAGGRDDAVEDGSPAEVVPVGVVQLARPVDAEPDEVVVLGEERAPRVVEQDAVGLERALDRHARGHAALFGRARPPEEVETHQRRLAALPGQGHLRHPLRPGGLRDVRFHDLVGHAEVASRVQGLLLEKEAVVTPKVAARPGGLGHHVERGGRRLAHALMVLPGRRRRRKSLRDRRPLRPRPSRSASCTSRTPRAPRWGSRRRSRRDRTGCAAGRCWPAGRRA